mmetsp:Transcript_35000/g.99198  ORF Transcript_35000/g.99198 Transcript_35000/m.99198 type:complete len:227 (-) Transcript_35000:1265-1945(-)
MAWIPGREFHVRRSTTAVGGGGLGGHAAGGISSGKLCQLRQGGVAVLEHRQLPLRERRHPAGLLRAEGGDCHCGGGQPLAACGPRASESGGGSRAVGASQSVRQPEADVEEVPPRDASQQQPAAGGDIGGSEQRAPGHSHHHGAGARFCMGQGAHRCPLREVPPPRAVAAVACNRGEGLGGRPRHAAVHRAELQRRQVHLCWGRLPPPALQVRPLEAGDRGLHDRP